LASSKDSNGFSRRARSLGFSRSKTVISDGHCDENWCARVVLPHCRGPKIATAGLPLSRRFKVSISGVLSISMLKVYHEISTCQVEFSSNLFCLMCVIRTRIVNARCGFGLLGTILTAYVTSGRSHEFLVEHFDKQHKKYAGDKTYH